MLSWSMGQRPPLLEMIAARRVDFFKGFAGVFQGAQILTLTHMYSHVIFMLANAQRLRRNFHPTRCVCSSCFDLGTPKSSLVLGIYTPLSVNCFEFAVKKVYCFCLGES